MVQIFPFRFQVSLFKIFDLILGSNLDIEVKIYESVLQDLHGLEHVLLGAEFRVSVDLRDFSFEPVDCVVAAFW